MADKTINVKITADTANFDKGIAKVTHGISKFSKMIAAAGVAAAGAFAVSSVKSAMDFENQLARVSTMLDKNTMSYLPKFDKGLEDMSMRFGESTSTLSKGLYDVLSASVAPSKAMDVLDASAKAAAAGLSDTGTAADAITTIMNSYGMGADSARTISDKLFTVIKRGKTTFGELAPSIGRVASTASMAGLNFNELGATIATLTRSGISTDEAMTAISGVLATFLKPTDDAKKAAHQFGFELSSNTLKSIGLTGVLKKLKGASAEQLATLFPNIRGLKGIAAALGDVTGLAKDYNMMLDSTGATQEAYNKITGTTAFRMKQLKESFNAVKTTFGKLMLPHITPYVTGLIDILNTLYSVQQAELDIGGYSIDSASVMNDSFGSAGENIARWILDIRKSFARLSEGIYLGIASVSSYAEGLEKTRGQIRLFGEEIPVFHPLEAAKWAKADLASIKNDWNEWIIKPMNTAFNQGIANVKKNRAELAKHKDEQEANAAAAAAASAKEKALAASLDQVGSSAGAAGKEIAGMNASESEAIKTSWHEWNIEGITSNKLLSYVGSLTTKTTLKHVVEIQLKWDGRRITVDSLNNKQLVEEVGREVLQQIQSSRALAFGSGG